MTLIIPLQSVKCERSSSHVGYIYSLAWPSQMSKWTGAKSARITPMPPVLPATTEKCGHYAAIFLDIEPGSCFGPSDEKDREEKGLCCCQPRAETKYFTQ